MPRYGMAIWAAHPRTGTIHSVAVEVGFEALPEGTPLPHEAFARTLCRARAQGYRVVSLLEVAATPHLCQRCS